MAEIYIGGNQSVGDDADVARADLVDQIECLSQRVDEWVFLPDEQGMGAEVFRTGVLAVVARSLAAFWSRRERAKGLMR